jgi:hypothetical protein
MVKPTSNATLLPVLPGSVDEGIPDVEVGGVSPDSKPRPPAADTGEAWGCPLTPRSKVFADAAAMQREEPESQIAAEHVHSFLHPQFWGVSRTQLEDFIVQVREAIQKKDITNPSQKECNDMNHPEWYYDQKKFDNPSIGPKMHAVNAKFIIPRTKNGDPIHTIRKLSYSCMVNSLRGLICDLFISHAWDEGVFEFASAVLSTWPQQCAEGGAYICFLSNPQNLLELIGKQIAKPEDSPFYKVLKSGPAMMLMVPNSNTPIHCRLWCVYEAYCSVNLKVTVKIAGDPMLMITDEAALKEARDVDFRRKTSRLFMITAFVIGFLIFPPLGFLVGIALWIHLKKTQELQEDKEREAKLKLVDVTKAKCSVAKDEAAIRQRIKGREAEVNELIRRFIPTATAGRKPPGLLCRCFCPPCSVLMHQGPGLPMVCAFFLCSWFTVLCWKPKVYPGEERRPGEPYEPPKQQTMESEP